MGRGRRDHHQLAVSSIETFIVEFNHLVGLGRWVTQVGLGGRPQLVPGQGLEAEFAQQQAVVNRAAAPAAIALQKVGALIDYKLPGSHAFQQVNPVAGWSELTRERPRFGPQDMIDRCDTAIGLWSPAARELVKGPGPGRAQRFARFFGQLNGPVRWAATTVAAIAVAGTPICLTAYLAIHYHWKP